MTGSIKFVNIIYCISRFQHGKVQILQYRARELSSGGREGGKEGSCYSDIINVTGRRDGTRAGDRLLNAGMHKNFTDWKNSIIEIEPNDCFRLLSSGVGRRNVSGDKRKDPSHPRPPHIFNTRFFYLFFFYFINPWARAHCLTIVFFIFSILQCARA